MLKIGQLAPDFEQDTSNGSIRLHEWIQGWWCLLFTCPSDRATMSSPQQLAGLAEAALLRSQWEKRRVKLIGLADRSSDGQARWAEEFTRREGIVLNFPVIADGDRAVSRLYRIAAAETAESASLEKCHVFVIDPLRRIRLVQTSPASLGCDFAGLQAAIETLQKADARSGQAAGRAGKSESSHSPAPEQPIIYA